MGAVGSPGPGAGGAASAPPPPPPPPSGTAALEAAAFVSAAARLGGHHAGHRIIESLRLEKKFKIPKSNHKKNTCKRSRAKPMKMILSAVGVSSSKEDGNIPASIKA
ncbi:uncharacterized protein LOC128822320 [Vidua macroura]|uniref:uncharacterized protein LOC128822320 n=1 Tax=Vidua macroura TaxID=187451 RepID=UPI0023A7FC5D|nr:uncharacterized protein LOC128822320 [Vidua macroura]